MSFRFRLRVCAIRLQSPLERVVGFRTRDRALDGLIINLNGNPVGSMPPTEIDGDSSKQSNSYGGSMVGTRRLNETAVDSDASLGEVTAALRQMVAAGLISPRRATMSTQSEVFCASTRPSTSMITNQVQMSLHTSFLSERSGATAGLMWSFEAENRPPPRPAAANPGYRPKERG